MAIVPLTPAERDAALARLTGWTLREDGLAICRSLRFADFAEAFGFMTRIAFWPRRPITIRSGSTFTTAWTSP